MRNRLLALGAMLAFASTAIASVVVNSPVVVQYKWQSAPLKDESGYVRTTAPCAVFSDYPAYRVFPAGMVFQMITNPNPHPAADPSVWMESEVGGSSQYLQGVHPLGGGPGFYLPTNCLEGVRPA